MELLMAISLSFICVVEMKTDWSAQEMMFVLAHKENKTIRIPNAYLITYFDIEYLLVNGPTL